MQKPKPVNKVKESIDKPVPALGTHITVPAAHLFNMKSTVPCVRIKQDERGVWQTIDPHENSGLIVFITESSTNPKVITITRVREKTVAFAIETYE